MKPLFLILFVLLINTSIAQNVIIIDNAFARPGDTITVSISISNTNTFISFQFDLPLPENVSFLSNSIQMSVRSANHVAIGNTVESNILRIFSYSPNNAAFQGNTGEVVSFQLVVGNIRGEFPMTLENGIIGDSLSSNILTGIENGILSVFPLGVKEPGVKSDDVGLTIFPNPVIDHADVSFAVTDLSEVILNLIDQDGRILKTTNMGKFGKGSHSMELPINMMKQLKPRKMYYFEMSVKSTTGTFRKEVVKIIRIDK